ncbi:MAG TPA: small ribosomal subunit Rsm22 family protein [Blastocatellia bacterium]|nr:small ribosomal subunit Rsm22 family protein [Blastocatellia bacterium]
MQLPAKLQQAIEQEAARIGLSKLAQAASELSANYRFRQGGGDKFMTSEAHRIAYIATRMPATYAALRAVLRALLMPVTSLLDLGAGPGTAAWAGVDALAELQTITLIERDQELIRFGQMFAAQADHATLRAATWLAQDLATTTFFPPHDLVICSYALGELPAKTARDVVQAAWQAASKALVLIEPGSMNGFNLIKQLREDLLQAGGHLDAPCPHEQACPMSANDWCHFAARVERSALHRKLKAGALGYEDEKFSYVVLAKEPVQAASARVLRRPDVQTGFVQLQLCTTEGLQALTVTRRDKATFKRARKVNWGDAWE